MRLFTSNSKYQEIIQICIYTLVIGILYYVFVAFIPKGLDGASQWQSNVLKAQDFVFDNKAYTHVFVGSSEAYNVPVGELSDKWANLGFASDCSITGLEVIIRSGKPIEVVVIEVNGTLLRGQDDDLLSEITTWHNSPIGRQNTRIDYLLYLCNTQIKHYLHKEIQNGINDEGALPKTDVLAIEKENMSRPLHEEKMCQMLTQLKSQIDKLQHQGVRVVLTETPNDPSLHDLRSPTATRNLVYEYFPPDKYEYFDVDWRDYKTKDGIHLAKFSSRRYAQQIIEKFSYSS